MSMIVGPLCTHPMRAWLSLMGSRQRHTVLFALGTMTEMLHHSAVSNTPSGANICSPCSLSSFFLKGI